MLNHLTAPEIEPLTPTHPRTLTVMRQGARRMRRGGRANRGHSNSPDVVSAFFLAIPATIDSASSAKA